MGADLPPAAAAQLPNALDAAAIARLRELDPSGQHGVVARVLSTYDGSLRRLLAQLEAGRDQATVVAGVAHTLKSSSASVGALRMAAACAAIEERVRAGNVARLQDDVEQLLREGRDTLVAVAELLKT